MLKAEIHTDMTSCSITGTPRQMLTKQCVFFVGGERDISIEEYNVKRDG